MKISVTGEVYFEVIAKGEEPSRVRVNAVHEWGELVGDGEYRKNK